MNCFVSMVETLENFFGTPTSSLPAHIRELVAEHYSIQLWDAIDAKARTHFAAQWDFDNDPAKLEFREGLEALTDPDSPTYSLPETQRLRADHLPVNPVTTAPEAHNPVEWTPQESYKINGNLSTSCDVPHQPKGETKEQRQDRRLAQCEKAGLTMTKQAAQRLPNGVGALAIAEGITRQAFSEDVKAAIRRREDALKQGSIVHRI